MADVATLPLLLKQLRLTTMGRLWEDLAQRAEAGRWTLGQYLAALCEEELLERERRRLERYLKESRLPPAKTLAHLNFDAAPSLPRQQILALDGDSFRKTQSLAHLKEDPQSPSTHPDKVIDVQQTPVSRRIRRRCSVMF